MVATIVPDIKSCQSAFEAVRRYASESCSGYISG